MVLDSLKGKKKKYNRAESASSSYKVTAWTKKKQLKCKIYREENFKNVLYKVFNVKRIVWHILNNIW